MRILIGVILASLLAIGGAIVVWRSSETAPTRAHPQLQSAVGRSQPRPSPSSAGRETAPTAPGPIHFTDLTAGSGIDFVHVSGDSSEKPFPAANGSGVAAFDFDLDGRVDLYFLTGTSFPIGSLPSGPTSRCYRNLGNWHFQDVSAQGGLDDRGFSAGVAIGDIDSDGFPDVFINSFGPHRLYLNSGDGTFREVAASAGVDVDGWGTGAAFLDYDNDGFLDLYVCHYAIWSLATNQYCGDQALGVRLFCNPTLVEPAPHFLFHNEGNGKFRDATVETGVGSVRGRGQGVVAADFNGDRQVDLYVTNDLHPNFLFLNTGGGRFVEAGQESGTATDFMGRVQAGMGVDAADLNRDGLIDLFVTNYEGEHNALYENLGQGLFQEVSRTKGLAAESIPWIGWGTGLVDFDLDGWPDVVVTNGHTDNNLKELGRDSPYAQPAGLWQNVHGRFQYCAGAAAGSYFGEPHAGRGLAVADFDDDGDPDLVITHQDAPPALLRNDCRPAAGLTRRIRLIGSVTNRDAVGTEIRLLREGETILVQPVKGGGSYLSASNLIQFLPCHGEFEGCRVELRWPGQKTSQILPPVAGFQIILERTAKLDTEP